MQFDSLVKIKFPHQQTPNAIEFSEIEQKTYESVEQFENDIKSFVNHCQLIHPYLKEASEELIESVEDQIGTMNACVTCYENSYEFQTTGSVENQCTNRHLLVWANTRHYDDDGFWPAKVLAVNAEEEMFRIQYFGDYTSLSLPLNKHKCYLYSKGCPDQLEGVYTDEYYKALDVSSFYLNLNFFQIYDIN